jgi:hypothetical protein
MGIYNIKVKIGTWENEGLPEGLQYFISTGLGPLFQLSKEGSSVFLKASMQGSSLEHCKSLMLSQVGMAKTMYNIQHGRM